MDKPLRILAVVNVPWDPRLGAARVWIELAEEWRKAGHHVEKFCLTDAFPEPAPSPAVAAIRLLRFPFRAARFIRENSERFDVVDALVGTLPFSKKSLGFGGLIVARFVGLWSVRKGAKDWAGIIRQVRSRVPDARFLFLGTMIANEKVWNDLALEPADFIEVVPQFDPGDLPRLLSDGTVGAFPSYVEGFGMAVVEQLAAGLPTVAYDAPGPRDILANLPQLLVPAGDATGFGEAISAILTADLAHYRELSDRSVETGRKFSWPDIARETAAEYRKYLHDAYA